MIKYLITLILILLTFLTTHASGNNESLLKELDQLLKESTTYVRKKESRIDYLKELLQREEFRHKKYDVIFQLIEEYKGFQSDSTFQYIEKNRLLAQQEEQSDKLLENKFQYIFVCAQSGFLNEAETVLEDLQNRYDSMTTPEKIEFYKLYERLYMNLREYTSNSHLEKLYEEKEIVYSRRILELVDPVSKDFYYYSFKVHYADEDFEAAGKDIIAYNGYIDSISNEAARGLYHLSLIYKARKDTIGEERALIQSAMVDIQSAVKQNRSLRLLAQIRYRKGDIRRAYTYLNVSLSDANFYNTRLRSSQIAEALPIIQEEYQVERDRQESRLVAGIMIVSLWLCLLFVFALYLRKKKQQLQDMRLQLIHINEELNLMNAEMRNKNDVLSELTDNLMESDRIKEKYISHFLKLCSMYIQKIGEYQKLVNRKIKAGQIEDLCRINSSTQYLLKESKDFYAQFDEAFLQIYPTFVREFNQLLKEDQQFVWKEGDMLNPELRIHALIRLGIKDSSQLAEFMGYNPVTVYTYRTKVRSRARNKDSFERDVQKIGRKY